jgi:hypothetical protein
VEAFQQGKDRSTASNTLQMIDEPISLNANMTEMWRSSSNLPLRLRYPEEDILSELAMARQST